MLQIHKLDNKIELISDYKPGINYCILSFWVKSGVVYEDVESGCAGYSHLLEHMLFKGTDSMSYLDIFNSIDNVGGYVNAFTDKELTCYYIKVLTEHVDIALKILVDIFFKSTLNSEELAKEKNVVLEEISMYNDSPQDILYENFVYNIFKPSRLGNPILGDYNNISNSNDKLLRSFYKSLYTTDNLIVSVAGDFHSSYILDELNKITFSKSSLLSNYSYNKPCDYNYNIINKHHKDLDQIHFMLGFPLELEYGYETSLKLSVINKIIAGSSSSRLYIKIREKMGLTYSISSHYNLYKYNGFFAINSSCTKNVLQTTLNVIKEEIQILIQNGISYDELLRSKRQIKSNIVFKQNNLHYFMESNVRNKINFGNTILYDDLIKLIDSIDIISINSLIKSALDYNKVNLYFVGNMKGINISKV